MRILSIEIRQEADVVLARQRARQVSELLGFPLLDQTRIGTATSEVARSAFQFSRGGRAEFFVEQGKPPSLVVRIVARAPGPADSRAGLGGEASELEGQAPGVRRLMDRFQVEASPGGGATVAMAKALPGRRGPLSPQELERIAAELSGRSPRSMLDELQYQNQELIQALQELRDRQAEIMALHRDELEETNRGVVALYAELDENAKVLRRISDLKSRFLSNMSHEFRSPVNTILTLTSFLLEGSDGALNEEQSRQVTYIRKAADGLHALVNDLLDLAKVEAGKAVVRPRSFEVGPLFESLRGVIRPLLSRPDVALVFEAPFGVGPLQTDEGKLAQILQNFLSNAAKFTERGEIRVAARAGPGDTVLFSVADTGVGIAPADRERIFEEFGQVENPLQGRVKGTGLGLPLSRKLAELLGGNISVKSEPGVGSTFFAVIPRVYREPGEEPARPDGRWEPDPGLLPLLVVEDDPVDMLLYEKVLKGSEFQVLPARSLDEARKAMRRVRPVAIILDILLEAESGWTLLTELKSQPATRDVPVLVLTHVDGQERALTLGAADFALKPVDQAWLLERLGALGAKRDVRTVLIIDDSEADRRRLRECLAACGPYRTLEADGGERGLAAAVAGRPDVIFLDLVMPDMTGLEVMDRLGQDPATSGIPIIINTAKYLDEGERKRLGGVASAILEKTAETGPAASGSIRAALARAGIGQHASTAPSEA
ncbi:response regulator [Aquisphaera giovannonii]|nr:response regulator [Aquisphaera giovannonii]